MIKKIFGLLLFISLLAGTALTASAAGFQFTRNLYPGLRNDPDVMKMQDLLRNLGFFNLPTSSGNYFAITTDSVKKFQTASGIKPVNGYFGPLTRGQANKLTTLLQNVVTPPPNPLSGVDRNATSTYYGEIKIDYVTTYEGIKTEGEYIVLTNASATNTPISITGLKLVNSRKEEFIIPKGHNLPGIYSSPRDDIAIVQYGTAKIISGRQAKMMNFRENICVGFFDQTSDFNKMLKRNCPQPDISSSASILPDHCIQIFESAQACRTIDPSTIQITECVAFADAHYNYQGCVNDNKNAKNFYSKNWLIWMQRPTRFMRDLHDTITLYDQYGRVVDKYSY